VSFVYSPWQIIHVVIRLIGLIRIRIRISRIARYLRRFPTS
jgi:hypothetical protein